MAETLTTKQYIENEKLINEEYKIWKKTVPLLYDSIKSLALPTYSMQATPLTNEGVKIEDNKIQSKFLLSQDNSIELWQVGLPSTLNLNNDEKLSAPSNASDCQFKKLDSWEHSGDVLKIVQLDNQYLTLNDLGEVNSWNVSNGQHLSKVNTANATTFEPLRNGLLSVGHSNGDIKVFDSKNEVVLNYSNIHDLCVNDLSMNSSLPNIIGSVSDDCAIGILDMRIANDPLLTIKEAHKDVINCIEFNPKLENIFVTGSADNVINIWDLRQPVDPIRSLYGHNGGVNKLRFNPTEPQFLMSSSNDRRIHIWDLLKVDEEFDSSDFIKNDKDDPCLKFIHGGHTGKVLDCSWLPNVYNTIITSAEDGLIDVWKPHYYDDDDEEEEEEKEDN